MDFQGKRALITGASMGLGKALAEECARRGMDLFLVALPDSGLPVLAGELAGEFGVETAWLEGDLTEASTLERLRDRVEEEGLDIDLLINNAGIGTPGHFLDHSLEYHEATIELNALALVRLVRLFLPDLRRRNASILNVASLGAFFPMPTMPIYAATKSFVLHFSLALREELGGTVGVSVLCPNAIRTTPDVNRYIDNLGPLARRACFTPECIARSTLDGVARNRAVIVPGAVNRVIAFISQVVPRALINRTIRHYWGTFLRCGCGKLAPAGGGADHV
ncbi:MAG TPA: SDR family oxidoreductase [Spirochaetia bacterium]|nr:SDR family oxidoreductase [Spirochaetales bacterium]HRY78773.1 SDR family oxidoreductase [Spirochaetia bacterium]HRZ89149.1 SDR family oxidoreductase [Spirochaetia bacterium]